MASAMAMVEQAMLRYILEQNPAADVSKEAQRPRIEPLPFEVLMFAFGLEQAKDDIMRQFGIPARLLGREGDGEGA
jgi:hypothetical protein